MSRIFKRSKAEFPGKIDLSEEAEPHSDARDAPDREYLKHVFGALEHSVKEARYGVVRGDMHIIVELLNRLDLVIGDARTRLGLGLVLHHRTADISIIPSGPAEQLLPQLRLEPIAAEESEAVVLEFPSGQVWERPDGRPVFIVCGAGRETAEIQWFLEGHFKNQGSIPIRDLSIFVIENKLKPVCKFPLP